MASPTIRPGHDTPGGDPMAHYEPQARFGHWTALINGKLYTYGGYYPGAPQEPPGTIEVLNLATELWEHSTTSGPPPPGFIDAACIVIGQNIYHFGGHNGNDPFNTIHQLDTHTLTWKELLPTNPQDAPMCKSSTAMVSFNEHYLVTFAGYGDPPNYPYRGAEYIPDPEVAGRRGWTNELLVFDTSSRRWSSPETTGSPPPPSACCSFTRVDHHRAVVYGGEQLRKLLPNHVYILDMESWVWVRVMPSCPGQPWPTARSYHSAVSLHDPDSTDPRLIVWWGQANGKVLSDAWVFQVDTYQWKEISLPDALRGRLHHTTTIVHCDSTQWNVINIGGLYEYSLGAPLDSLVPVPEAAIVELRSSGPSGDLVVTDVRITGRRTPTPQQQPWRASGFPHVGAESLSSQLPLLQLYLPSLFTQPTPQPAVLEPSPQRLPFPSVRSLPLQTPSIGVQQPLPPFAVPGLYPTVTVPTTIQSSGYETFSLPPLWTPTVEYEQHTAPVEPTLEFPPPSPYYPFLPSIVSQQLPETTTVTEVGVEQEEPVTKEEEEGAVSTEETKPVVKLEPKQEKEEPVAEKKDVARELVQKLRAHEQLLEEKEEEIAKKDRQLTERDEVVAKMEKQVAVKDDQLAEKDAQLAKELAECSDLIQRKSQEIEALKAVTTTDYLRGIEVVAGTIFRLSGRRQTHVWERHGLRLHIPEGALPPDHTGCRVDVRAALAGQFEFADSSHPVSAMYCLSCRETFLQPVTLEVQHCAVVRDAAQCSRLRFAIAKCSQPELPYKFKSLDRGVFTPNSSYGSITLSQFSIVGITGDSSEESYYAKLFYRMKRQNQWKLDFTVTRNLELSIQHVDERYSDLSAEPGPDLEVQFEKDKISLDIPDHVTVVEEGWKIVPLTPPLITKEQVDNFKAGRRIPTCQLKVVCIQKENPADLDYRLNLLGAKEPYNFMYFSISPGGGAVTGEKRRLQQTDTEQENGQVKRRKNDSGESSAAESSQASSITRSSTDSSTGTSSLDILLTAVSKLRIVRYLKRISRNEDLLRLGEGLGLNGSELRKKVNSDSFLDDMVRDWLERKHRVDEVGRPTWRKLITVLRQVEQNGLANDIEEEEVKMNN